MNAEISTPEYRQWLAELKTEIRSAQSRAALAVNAELIRLYWKIGRSNLVRQQELGWGAGVIKQVAADLRSLFLEIKDFSAQNLYNMRKFALAWTEPEIFQQPVGNLPWGHNVALLDKLDSSELRSWYASEAVRNGWTRGVLLHQIQTRLHERQGQAITNFARTLPPYQEPAATALFKDPYVLDFVELSADAHERELERALIDRIRDFLLKLGKGFAFMGSQYHLDVGGDAFYVNLLFYHTKLHSHVVIDLKMDEFKPEFAGKMNFYLAAVDAQLRSVGDKPSIGLILCHGENGIVVGYALRDIASPIAVSSYEVLPPEIAAALPSPDAFASGLNERLGNDVEQEEEDDLRPAPGRR